MSGNGSLPFPPLIRKAETRIADGDAGYRVVDWLSVRFPYLERPGWLEQLAAGHLKLNGETLCEDRQLQPGDLLEFISRELEEPPVSWQIEILFENEDYLVVNKPSMLPCHPAGSYFNHTLWAWLKQSRGLENICFVNRLDRETSGLVLIAGNSVSASAAAAALKAPDAVREYLVAVEGHHLPEYFMADGWIGPAKNSLVHKKRQFYFHREDVPDDGKVETAKTEFFRIGEEGASGVTLLKARLHTGRTHQIRATLHSLGYPVVGDKLYGPDEKYFLDWIEDRLSEKARGRLRLPSQALHAVRLKIRLPGVSQEEFRAGVPSAWSRLGVCADML